jgi:hypothetical protein
VSDGDIWHPLEAGGTIGTAGSEQGVIIADDEHRDGARITLERDAQVGPFAITCGIYGWMFHTRFFPTEAEARRDYEAMKVALNEIVQAIPFENDPDRDAGMNATAQRISAFVERFP